MYNMRELIVREDGQEYAKVRAVLGDGRFKLDCYDNQIRLGHIRGSLRFKSVPPKKRRPVDPSRPTKAVKSVIYQFPLLDIISFSFRFM